MSSWDATLSFSWYLYQADVALLVTLKKINEIWTSNSDKLEKWSLEVEWEEDFSLLQDWHYKELYQVKEYKSTNFSDYREAIEKLFENLGLKENSVWYLCTFKEITDWRSNPPELTNKKLIKKITSIDDSLINKKLKIFNKNDILWNDKDQKVFWDYKNIETNINKEIKKIKPELESDDNTVWYIREYLTIKIKKYIQEKAKLIREWYTQQKIIPFVNKEKDNLGFNEWIFSFIQEIDQSKLTSKYLNNINFKKKLLKNIIIKSLDIEISKSPEFKENNFFFDNLDFYINHSKRLISNEINKFNDDQLKKITKILNPLEDFYNSFLNESYSDIDSFILKFSNIINIDRLKRLLLNIGNYISEKTCKEIKSFSLDLFWKRLIIADEKRDDFEYYGFNLVLSDFYDYFENVEYISSYKSKTWSIENIEKSTTAYEYFDNTQKVKFSNNITKYKDIKICCFQCPYKWKHDKLTWKHNWIECWDTDCDLHTK